MDKKRYYINMHTNIGMLSKCGLVIDGDYICPLCLNPFAEAEIKEKLTEEDVPQASLGGEKIALTCHKCNSTCGSKIDCHLFNFLMRSEQNQFLEGTDRSVRIEKNGQVIRGMLKVEENKALTLHINPKNNNPHTWSEFQKSILLPDEVVNMTNATIKRDPRCVSAAIMKNAYLLLFAKTGYAFLMDRYYDSIRKQIEDPMVYHLPERLWTIQNLQIDDGIYLTNDNRYRGFFTIYTLKLKLSYKVCVLIPVPNVPYLVATKHLQQLEAGSHVPLNSLPQIDYLTDEDAIISLRKWVYGWDMKV